MDLFRYAPGGANPLLGGSGGKGALMGVAPGVFWFFVAAAIVFVVAHAALRIINKPQDRMAAH